MPDTPDCNDLQQVLGNSPLAHMLVGTGGHILFLNPAFSQIFGFAPNDFGNLREWFDRSCRNTSESEEFWRQWEEWTACRGPVSLIRDLLHKSGVVLHVNLSVAFLQDGRAVLTLQDETGRIRMERESADRQEKLDALDRATFEAVLITDKGYVLECNQAALDMFGYSREEFIGMYATDLMAKEFRGITAAHMLSGLETPCEGVALRRNGTTFQAELQGRTFTYRNRPARATAIRDISERKSAERVPYALYATSTAVSTIRDLDQLFRAIHAILHNALGAKNFFIAIIDKERNRLTFPYFEDERDDDSHVLDIENPETKSLTLHVIRSGLPLFVTRDDLLGSGMAKDIGLIGPMPAVWIGVPLKPRGIITGAMAIQHYEDPHFFSQADMDLFEAVSAQVALGIERIMAEEALSRLNDELEEEVERRTEELTRKALELEQANARLRELDSIKSSLLSSVSHEMRTPLTSIRGFAAVVAKDFTRHFLERADNDRSRAKGARIQSNLDVVVRESERLTRLINDFLDLSRIEAGHMEWNDGEVDVVRSLQQAMEIVMGDRQDQRDVSMSLDLAPDLPPLHADGDKIQQLVINLLHNAVKFTPKGEIGLQARHEDGRLVMRVWDTGLGIGERECQHVFDKFYQSSQDGKPRGTGLGLAICKQIAEHYGGSISVRSAQGKGSVFTVELPCPGEKPVGTV